MDTLELQKIIATRQNSVAGSAAPPASLDYGELAVDIDGVLRTGNKNKQVITHVISTDRRLADTRNPRVTQLSTENLNSITTPGFYYAGGNNTVVNKPSGVDAFGLLVEKTAGGFFAQTLISANQMNGKIFFRQISSGTAWTAWSNFYTTTYKPTPAEIGAATASHTHPYLLLSGGTMTGPITLSGNPTANLHAATKQYVDSKIASSSSGDMLKSVYDTDEDGVVDKAEKLSGLTAGRVLVTDSSGNSTVSAVTSTELSYLDGVTSNVQIQINGKAASAHTHNYAGSSSAGGVANSAIKLSTARNITIGDTKKTFDGSADISWSLGEIGAATVDSASSFSGAARAATQLATARMFTIGDSGKSFNGTTNVSWSYDDIRIIKTYTSISQLGYSSATSIGNLYNAMSNNSQLLISDSDITNPPEQGSMILVVKRAAQNGYAQASAKSSGKMYVMFISGSTLSGSWQSLATEHQGEKADSAVQSVNGKNGNYINLIPEDIGAVKVWNRKVLADGLSWKSGSINTPVGWGNYSIIRISTNFGHAFIPSLRANESSGNILMASVLPNNYMNIAGFSIARNSTGGSLSFDAAPYALRLAPSGVTALSTELSVYKIEGFA